MIMDISKNGKESGLFYLRNSADLWLKANALSFFQTEQFSIIYTWNQGKSNEASSFSFFIGQ